MNGIKGFSIITIIFLLIAAFCISIGNSEENKQFEKEYNKTLIAEIDLPVEKILTQIRRDNQREKIYEWMDTPYIMSDIHRDRFLVFFSYREELKTLLPIKKITINDKEVVFTQEDNVIDSDKTRSFVVIDLADIVEDEGSAYVCVCYDDNKLGFQKREFIIYDHVIDEMVYAIKKTYDQYHKAEEKL